MARTLSLLLLLGLTALADGRTAYIEAKKALQEAYFDELEPDRRDRLFEALGSWDHPEVVPPTADVISRFGTYLATLEAQMAERQGRLELYKGRRALSEQEIGLRNHHLRAIEKLEARWRRARRSEDLLVKVVGGYQNPKTIQNALSQLQKHASSHVRQVLARACARWHGQLKDAKLSKKAFAALKRLRVDKEAAVRVAVARALGAFHRAEALALLKLSVKDADWRVRAAAVKSLYDSRSAEAVTVLIETMKRETGRLKDDINLALQSLTGESYGFADSWARWWQSVGRQLPRDPKRPRGSADTSLKAKDTSRFYGIPTRSEHICYIIDVSGSMNKEVKQLRRVVITGRKESEMPVEGKTRIEVAKNELKRAVSNLNPGKVFNVIFFNQAVKTWRPEMTKATREAKAELRKELGPVVASGTTYTLGALREAFVMAGVLTSGGKTKKTKELGIDTIFLLSDGGPTDNRMEAKPMDPEIILESVRQWNRDAGIVIHTIAVDTLPEGTYFLKQLAAQNGGVFVERKE